MNWLPKIRDVNPMENLQSILKWYLFWDGRQLSSKKGHFQARKHIASNLLSVTISKQHQLSKRGSLGALIWIDLYFRRYHLIKDFKLFIFLYWWISLSPISFYQKFVSKYNWMCKIIVYISSHIQEK